ncbi:MAG: hypothetical protein Q8R86_06180 [Sulfuricurvum sp.]|nr:hypothetical protein [Sulfuricurvum sp.]
MFRLILPLVISVSLFAQSISLADLAFIVQKKDKTNIVFASDVQKTMMVDFPSDYTKSSYMPLFRSILEVNNLHIRENDGIYLVSVADPANSLDQSNSMLPGTPSSNMLQSPPSLVPSIPAQSFQSSSSSYNMTSEVDFNVSFVSHKLDFLQFNDVKPLLDFSIIPYSFSTVSKTITFKENKKNKQLIKKLIKEIQTIDIQKDQVTLRITIFDTNENKLRNVGISNTPITFDFNLLSKAGSILSGAAASDFKVTLNALNSTGATVVNQSTAYLISDSEKLDFKKVVSIPFLDEDFALTTQTGTNQSKKYKYRDIGFKVLATPTIVGEMVYLDFSLTVGSVLTSGDRPITSENTILNKFSVKKGDIVLLTGISKDSLIDRNDETSFFDGVPVLSDLFAHRSRDKNREFFNVSIEIL